MAEQYKIELGVQLDTSDINQQIKDASKNIQPIKLKIDVDTTELANIKPIKLKIDADTTELTNTIKGALNTPLKGIKNTLTLDTSKIEASLDRLSNTIIDIKDSLGTLDSKSGMKDLLSSINQIATALGKVENESDNVVKSLSALSKKDFSINLGLDLGKKNNSLIAYGRSARKQVIPELEAQIKDIENLFGGKQASISKLMKQGKNVGFDVFTDFNDFSSDSAIKKMEAMEKYINSLKKLATIENVNLDGFNEIHKDASALINDITGVENAVDKAGDVPEKLKNLFGGSIDGEKLSAQLDDIVINLNEIKNAISELSKNNAIDGLSQSFKKLSDTLDKLMTNAKLVQDVLGNVGSGVDASMSDVGVDKISQGQKELAQISTSTADAVVQGEERKQQAYRDTSGVIENLKTTLETMSVNRSSVDAIIKDMEELGFTATDTSVKMKSDGFDITVKGIDSIGRAITEIRHLDNETDEISLVGRKIAQSLTEADKFIKQQKNAVADLTNQINQLNRAATDQNANRPIKDSSHLDSLKSKYQEIIATIQKMGNASSATFDDERNEVKKLINEYKSLKSEFKNAENVSMDFKGADFASGLEIAKNRLREFKSDAKGFSQVTQTVEQLDRAIEGVGDKSSLDKFNDQLRVAKSELKAVKAEVLSNNDNLANKIRIDIETEKFENKVSQLHSQLDQLTDVDGSLNNLRASIKQVDDAYEAMKTATDDESLIQSQKRFAAAVEKTNNELKIQTREQRAANNAAKLADNKTALKTDMLNWLKKNSKATKEYKDEIDRLIASLDKLDQAGVNGVRRRFSNIDKDAELKGLKGLNFFDSMKSKIKEYSVYFGAAELFMYAEQGLRSMFEQVKLIDSAMTELKKVTNETDEAYSNFLKNAATRSREIGTTIDGLVSSTADFARLGYGFEDAQGLAEVANIYAVVGDEIEGVEGATESLISTMAAFKNEMNGMNNTDFAMSIIDKFNEIGNNFSISSGGIGEALERSASSLMAANNTIDESIALITAANTVVQDPEQVGTAFKTISMRIRGAKTELEEAGLETDGMVESTAKLRSEILALTGVDIMDGANQFKSTYAIMDELAVKWKDLSDIQQATVTELIAGKRQGNIVSSLMTNFDTAREALDASMNSAGSAMKEHEKWQQSLEAQINKVKASWQGLSQAFLSSDFLHGALEAVIKLVDGLTTLIDKLGLFPTLLSAFSIYRSFNGGGFFKPVIDEATGVAKGITNIFSGVARKTKNIFKEVGLQKDGLFKTSIEADKKAFAEYTNLLNNTTKHGVKIDDNTFNKIFKNASEGAKEFAQSGKLAAQGVDAFVNSQKAAEVATLAQNKSLGNASAIIKEYYSGCKNVQMSQADFAAAVNQTNPALATQLTASTSARGAMAGYTASLIGAKIASAALKVAAMALNAVLSYGIGILVSFVVEGIMSLFNAEEELAEKVDEVTSKFQEQHKELQKLKGDYDTSNESSMISKYEKLSKGVDNLGRNVSLTADEYSEYQSIVNKIADQFPSLISGYDAQGNALLSCKSNVEELTKAYEDLIKAQNREIFNNVKNIGKDFKNAVKDSENTNIWGNRMTYETIEILEDLYNNDYTVDEFDSLLNKSPDSRKQIIHALEESGVDTGFWSWDFYNALEETLETNPELIKNIIDDFKGNLEVATAGMKSIAQATLSDAFDISSSDYYGMSDTMKDVVSNIVNSFDYEFYKQYQDNPLGVKTYINNMLDQLKAMGKEDNAKIETAFDLRTQFNGGDISYGEYAKGLEDTGRLIDGLDIDQELKSQIKLSIGLNEDGLVDEYQRLRNRLASEEFFNISKPEYESFIKGLSSEELSVVWDVITKFEKTDVKETIADLKSAVELEMMMAGLTFDLNLEVESAGIEALNTALAESVSASGLSSDSITALKGRYADLEAKGYDLSVLFEETSHGIHLNRQEFNKLEKAYATDKLADVNGDLEEMKVAYDELGEAIKNTDDPVRKAELYNDRQTLAKKISEVATLAAQYEGLTSAYNDWLSAEEAGQERDMYENVISGFETVDDEISRGWIDDGTIKFLELLTGRTDLAGKSGKQLKEIYDSLDDTIKNTGYSIRDFFTVDEDGNSTNTGVYNFLDAIGQLEEEKFEGKDIVKRDKDGNIIGFDFKLAGGDEVIAEALGVSKELVQIMVRAADDAGFVISLDGTYKQLADLQNEARESAEYLKSIGKTDFEFDFNSTNLKNLNQQLEEAHKILDDPDFWNKDGTFNFDAKGATEAMQIVSTLQAKIDQLTEEKYGIGLTVEDEEFEEPLENLQEYGRTVATLNQLKLNPKANTEEIKELEGDLEEISKYFANLDDETKIKLGLDADDNWEDVKKKIEKGEVKIPTVLDIQTNMDKNLETLADLALLDSGLLSDSEEATIRKKYNIEVEADKVDTSNVDDKVKGAVEKEDGETKRVEIEVEPEIEVKTPTEKLDSLLGDLEGYSDTEIEVITKFIADPSDVENYTPEQKETIIKFIADTLEVDGYTPEEKKAYAKYLVDGGNLDDYTPEEKEAIVRYLIEGEAVDSYSPEEKQAIVKFLKNSGEVDNYTPAEKQAIAKFIKNSVEPDGYQPPNKEAIATYYKDSSAVDNYQPANKEAKVTFWATIKKVGSSLWGFLTGQGSKRSVVNGTANVDGTAFANGTTGRAFKQGSWGTKNSGTALVGELGREILVRDGRYYTIGDNGAEFIKYKKGDIIFNHVQSEELFANGRITSGGGRGKAFAEGTAFSSGSGGIGKVSATKKTAAKSKKVETVAKTTTTDDTVTTTTTTTTSSSSSSSSSSGSSGSSGGSDKVEGSAVGTNDKDKFEETFDWIEVAIERIEREIDNLDQIVNNAYKSWSDRNTALTGEISKVGNLISKQESAYKEYIAEANKVGLDESWASKVRNGIIDIESITDENLAEKIKDYETWYNKALDAKDAVEELKQTEAELYEQRFENVQSQYDGILRGFEHTESMLNEYISQAEAKGHIVSKNYYQALIDNEKNNIAELQKEQSDLIAKRDEAVASGTIVKGSQAWYDMCAEIDGVTQAIEEGNTALIEYANYMRDIDWEVFDLIQERISNVVEEANFLIDLMSYDKLFDDNGKLTDKGLATMGQHGVNYNTYMYAADEYGKEIAKLNSQIAENPYDQELINRRRELVELQREMILSAKDEKNAIRDLVEEGINLELDALQELIDKKNEELESEKDLYEYQKKVKEQTEEIASLEKQMAAYSGDNSEEAKAKVQELKISLEEAKTNLEETEYDKYLSDTQQMLDTLYEEYELILNERLDNVDALLSDMITEINTSATIISSALSTEATNVGTTLSEAMKGIWSVDEGNAKSVITEYGKGFQSTQTTTNMVLNDIKAGINSMVDDVDKDAQKKVTANKTTTSAKKNPTTTSSSSSNKTTTATNKSSGDGKPKIGDKVKFLSGKYYYDSQGVTPAGSNNHGKYVYITNVNNRDWATHPIHISTGKKLGSGDLGWLKKNQISGYATGKKNFLNNEIAWTQENGGKEFIVRPSDGAILTPIAKGDSVLTSTASSNIWDMANSPAEFIKDNLNLGVANTPNNANVQNNITQNLDKVIFHLPNVKNYDELVSALQKDPKFDKLIKAMTIDQLAGKSSLSKNKSIR